MRRLSDERGLLGIPFLKLGVTILLVIVVGYEAGTIVFTRFQAQDMAQVAATAAASAYRDTGDRQRAIEAARATLAERDPGARLIERTFQVAAGDEVTLTVAKRARTLIVQHIEFLEGFRSVRATATAGPSRL